MPEHQARAEVQGGWDAYVQLSEPKPLLRARQWVL